MIYICVSWCTFHVAIPILFGILYELEIVGIFLIIFTIIISIELIIFKTICNEYTSML